MDIMLKPNDIFLTRGPGLLSRLIRFFSRTIGESRTKVNHAGVVAKEGGVQDRGDRGGRCCGSPLPALAALRPAVEERRGDLLC